MSNLVLGRLKSERDRQFVRAPTQDVDIGARCVDDASMHFAKPMSAAVLGLSLGLMLSACRGSPPEVPSNVTTVEARHDHEGTDLQLKLDTAKLLACLQTSHSIPIGEAYKCKMQDNDYTVNLNGGATIITIHTRTQFTIDHQGFFANDCLYPMLFRAAHNQDPEPGGC